MDLSEVFKEGVPRKTINIIVQRPPPPAPKRDREENADLKFMPKNKAGSHIRLPTESQ
ncbi:hypothetical protein BC939DRAFT_470852 [Gamsiella multidivaricata]|uniref:uncharacterized protein n=1 Tax=Gamsiella multidivaricata TaxID=101098 RepID=UPI00221FF242|nr:uncharacterized protein BC939DRAFT_470852 [Gamsiella multidivaricata]KAI7815974.1 hypothetical protein BC939DRAFT_470852 [Gamsiella multidivaricata]